ncbi:LPD1 domain-containing protein [Aquimarina muelleri]|uniref:LPD1 domain-containing protein n=1 Tax=Aquimarina muelleri TaxID=279356 RepID=UPI003F68769A
MDALYTNDLGKIEDAGAIVRGGGIDRHWQTVAPEKKFYAMFGEKRKDAWLFDSNLALAHFNLRSIEFGNWMTQQDRANFLYASALSLHYLAQLLGVSDEDIGLGGRLSLALGARGHGNAKAHYESTPYAVINLTKTQGFGSLAHEYAHAVDNIISFLTKSQRNFVSGGRITDKGYNEDIAKNGNFFEQQFEEFFNLLYFTKEGEYTKFVSDISSFNRGDYYERRNEVFARSFEVYIFNLLKDNKIKNTFLVDSDYKAVVYPNPTLSALVKPIITRIVRKGFTEIRKHKQTLQGIRTSTGYKGFRKTIKEQANLNDTLQAMQRIALRDYKQVEGLAIELQDTTVAQTSENIWNYLRENTRYKLDTKGIEELRTPARSIVDGQKGVHNINYGIDCDDYTILISALLLNLGIAHQYRIAAYKKIGEFQHIYPVAFDQNGNAFVIDVVPEIPHFNYEEQPIIDLKTIPMELHELSGTLPVDTEDMDFPVTEEEIQNDFAEEMQEPYSLEGIEDDYEDSILESNFLSGFAEVYDESEADIVLNGTSDAVALLERGILAEVNKARQTLVNEKREPTVLSQLIDVDQELRLVDTVMQSWGNDEVRDSTLMAAIRSGSAYTNFYTAIKTSLDQLQNEQLNGFQEEELDEPLYLSRVPNNQDFLQDVLDDDEDLEGFEDEGFEDYNDFEQDNTSNLSGFFKKIFRKVGKVVKKVVKAVVRFNPATLVMRGAIILVLKINLFKFSEKLIYGYLTEAQARQQGLDLNEWRKIVGKLRKAERFFTKIGGRASKFRKAIVRGKAGKKTKLPLNGLGAIVTGTSTAAASGFIAFAGTLLKSINFKKLFKKIKEKIAKKKTTYPTTTPNTPSITDDMYQPEQFDRSKPYTTNNPPKMTFIDKVKQIFTQHKKKWIFGIVIVVFAIVGVKYYKKKQKKSKRSLAGIKAARTRAKNRKQLATAPARRTITRKRRTPALKGSTTTIRLPSKTVSRRTRKTSNASRLRAMHKKAKELQKTSPKTKYSTLLKRAAKQL